jgi:hypothetical protein
MTWWNASYVFRKEIVLSTIASSSTPASSFVELITDLTPNITNGTVRSDTEDIEIVHETADATPSYTVVGRQITLASDTPTVDSWEIQFEAPVEIPDTGKVYMYYGNPDLNNQPSRPSYTLDRNPLVVNFNDPQISFTRPEEHWIDGVSFTPNSVATFAFFGTSVNTVFESGPNRGKVLIEAFLELGIEQNTTLDTYNETIDIGTVGNSVSANVDSEGVRHEVKITVLGEKNVSSSSESIKILYFEYSGDAVGSLGLEETELEDWVTYTGGGLR